MMKTLKRMAAVVPVLALLSGLAGCNGGGTSNTVLTPTSDNSSAGTITAPAPVIAAGTTLTQVERLARPGINEGLLVTNDYLNAYNSIPPSSDATALGGPVGTEAVATLTALGNTAANINAIVTALIPDVMRIDTTITSGYAGGVTFTGAAFTSDIASIPTGGRLLLDDVIDITLKLLLHNPAASDNVSYDGAGAVGQGHHPLSTQFPYLAPAN